MSGTRRVRIVRDERVAGIHRLVAELGDEVLHSDTTRADVELDEVGVGVDPALGVEQCGVEVSGLGDHRGSGGPDHRTPHLLDDGVQSHPKYFQRHGAIAVWDVGRAHRVSLSSCGRGRMSVAASFRIEPDGKVAAVHDGGRRSGRYVHRGVGFLEQTRAGRLTLDTETAMYVDLATSPGDRVDA